MKKLLVRLVVAAVLGTALWQGAVAVRALFRKPVAHDAVIVNTGRRAIAALELRVGGQRIDLGALAARDTGRATFRVARDAPIELRWTWEDAPDEAQRWSGGWIARGPLAHRLHVTLRDDGGVMSRVTPVAR